MKESPEDYFHWFNISTCLNVKMCTEWIWCLILPPQITCSVKTHTKGQKGVEKFKLWIHSFPSSSTFTDLVFVSEFGLATFSVADALILSTRPICVCVPACACVCAHMPASVCGVCVLDWCDPFIEVWLLVHLFQATIIRPCQQRTGRNNEIRAWTSCSTHQDCVCVCVCACVCDR